MDCRFWPLICELKKDGNFGAIIMIHPNKVDKILAKNPYTRGWYQHVQYADFKEAQKDII
jgi:hypothetical protein